MGAHKLAVLIACAALGSSCTPTEETSTSTEALFFECGNGIRYPTTEVDFNTLYNGRAFYAVGRLGDGTVTYHLGHDIAYPEGEAIHPIACGRVVYYGPATGYGTLIVAIEHTLSAPTTVTNGLNEPVTIRRFISIYGHQRPSVERLFPFATRAEREAATYTRTWHRVQEDWDGSPTQPSGASPIIVMTDEVISYVEYHESPDSRTNPRNLNGDGGIK